MKQRPKQTVKNKALQIEKQLIRLDSSLAGTKTNYEWKKVMSGKEVVAMLKRNGWEEISQKGSHKKLKKNGMNCVVPMHDEIKRGTLGGIKSDVQLAENNTSQNI